MEQAETERSVTALSGEKQILHGTPNGASRGMALERAEANYAEAGARTAAVRDQIESARLVAIAAAVSGKDVPDYTALQLALEREVNRERAYAVAMERAREGFAAARQAQFALRASHARRLLADKIGELRHSLADLGQLNQEIAHLRESLGEPSAERIAHFEGAAGRLLMPPALIIGSDAAVQGDGQPRRS